jgi:cyclomaltodextrinase / maltogenic alpha-amylase / neopullulanase
MKTIHMPLRIIVQALLGALLCSARAADLDYSKEHARATSQSIRDSVVYELYPRNFSASGDFNGVTARLDELRALGVDVLWLMPIHPIGEKLRKGTLGSPYAVRDYYAINPDCGTTNDFKHLVAEAHQRGMKVILDIVVNHTAWDNVLMGTHPEFYKHDASGKIIPPVPEWTDVAGLNYDVPQLRTYVIDMLKHWMTVYGVDGFRCDVAHMVPTDFWEQARVELEKVNPDVYLLAEASKPDLLLKAFDLDYSWPLHGALNHVLINGAPASELRRSWEESRGQYPQGSLHLRISDNHDEARAVARFGIRGALAASVFMFTLDGIPLLYNGMEVGDATESGDPALFEKLPVFWKPKDRPPLRDIYRDLIRLRKQYAPFRSDRLVWLHNSDESNLISFMRLDAQDEFVIVINFSNRPAVGWVEVRNSGEFKPLTLSGQAEAPAAGFPLFRLSGFEWRIYHRSVAR